LVEVDNTTSTNDYGLKLFSHNHPIEGTVIFAHHQTKGKGQYDKTWESEPGKNITMSIILYPTFLSAYKQFYLNQAISLGIYEFVKDCILDAGCWLLDKTRNQKKEEVKIKWPNDIYVGDSKIAGILIENNITGSKINASVVGIGINVNQTKFNSYIPNATSLKLITGKAHSIKKLIQKLCWFIEGRYLQLKAGKYDLLKRDYLQSLYGYQQYRDFKTDGKTIHAQLLGVSEEGKLIVESNQRLMTYGFKEIAFV